MDELEAGDVIQISPEAACHDGLKGHLAFVSEPKSWGCVAGVELSEGVAYVRLRTCDFQLVGEPTWVPEWVLG